MIFKRISPLVIAISVLAALARAQAPAPWRYDLRPGDHLVYSYSFHREVHSDDAQTAVEAHFRTHVMVAGEQGGILSAGFQRNRESAELLLYRIKGKDKLAEERPKFEKRMQVRPVRFSEAMEFTTSGEPRYSWEIARESSSHLLPALHEIDILPPNAVKVRDRWHSMDLLGIEFEWAGSEQVHGKNCHRVRGTSSDGSITLSYWWSPESRVIERIELDGSYPVPGGTTREHAHLELESLNRNEAYADWLTKPETRLGALEALLLSAWIPSPPDAIASLAKSSEPPAQRLALAIAGRRGQPIATSTQTELSSNTNPEVKALAAAMLTPSAFKPSPDACAPSTPPRKQPPKPGTLFRAAPPEKPGPPIAYFLRIPITYRGDHPVPLLVYLSGGAGLALDGVNTANDVIGATDYLVLYPQAGDYWWKPEVAAQLDAAMRDVFNEFNVDRDRVYIAGFSNGGTGSLYMAELWPQRFAAVVSLMGAGQCNPDVQKALPNLINLPMLFVHGEKDPIISPLCSQVTYDALGGLHPPIPPQMRRLPDREHDLTLQSDDGLTLAFLKDKTREVFPKRVSLYMTDLNFPRQYWVEVLEKKSDPAEVTAEIKKDNRIEIHSHEVRKLRLHLRPELLPQPGSVRILWNGKQMYEGPLQGACSVAAETNFADPKLDQSDRKEFSLP